MRRGLRAGVGVPGDRQDARGVSPRVVWTDGTTGSPPATDQTLRLLGVYFRFSGTIERIMSVDVHAADAAGAVGVVGTVDKLGLLVGPFVKGVILDTYVETRKRNRDPLMMLREFQDSLAALNVSQHAGQHANASSSSTILNAKIQKWKDGAKAKAMYTTLGVRDRNIEATIQDCLTSSARQVWRRPDLAYHNVDRKTYLENMKKIDGISCECSLRHFRELDDHDVIKEEEEERVVEKPREGNEGRNRGSRRSSESGCSGSSLDSADGKNVKTFKDLLDDYEIVDVDEAHDAHETKADAIVLLVDDAVEERDAGAKVEAKEKDEEKEDAKAEADADAEDDGDYKTATEVVLYVPPSQPSQPSQPIQPSQPSQEDDVEHVAKATASVIPMLLRQMRSSGTASTVYENNKESNELSKRHREKVDRIKRRIKAAKEIYY